MVVVTCFYSDRYHPAYCTSVASSSLVVNDWLMPLPMMMIMMMTEQRRCKLTFISHNIIYNDHNKCLLIFQDIPSADFLAIVRDVLLLKKLTLITRDYCKKEHTLLFYFAVMTCYLVQFKFFYFFNFSKSGTGRKII